MVFRRDQLQRTVHTPAKLNLYLEVLGRRDDGYHELETLMVPLAIRDSLSMKCRVPARRGEPGAITFSLETSLGLRDSAIPGGQDNLVVRALELLRKRAGVELGADVLLTKRIPSEAGLGGGSSDAGAALRLANRVWGIDYDDARLSSLAAELGSDVPFFIQARAAICRGRGERIEPLASAGRFAVVIVKPPVGLKTPDVFRAHDRLAARDQALSKDYLPRLVDSLRYRNWGILGRNLRNRLEAAAGSLCPWVMEIKSVFDTLDCWGHQLSGSGTAYFGVCRHPSHALKLATMLRSRRLGLVFAAASCP